MGARTHRASGQVFSLSDPAAGANDYSVRYSCLFIILAGCDLTILETFSFRIGSLLSRQVVYHAVQARSCATCAPCPRARAQARVSLRYP
ncbi:hypothetical protein DM50_2997 [Burkholderia mallei]|nr:hypothetical protein DM50_2997 [Burkholderia mallei]KOT19020.1 hypothetical protein DM52_1792 [Burkholderia mallei]